VITAAEVLDLVEWTSAAGLRIWIDGGWAVDALLGKQTRTHRDVDIALSVADAPALLAGLTERGFTPNPAGYETDWNFEYGTPAGAVVDLHLLVLDESGTGGRMGEGPSAPAYPSGSLTGSGRIAGREVACISAPWLVRFHTGYQPDADDWADVRALCERFELPVPAEYDRFRFPAAVLPAVRGERALLTPEVRRDPALAGPLLAEDFVEFGSSGRVWRRDALLRALAEDPGGFAAEPLSLEVAELRPGCVLLTYSVETGGRTTLRSSLWIEHADARWRLRFHQGTLTASTR
jgi:lincosamide nucleotidyltransferase A/C/D/E